MLLPRWSALPGTARRWEASDPCSVIRLFTPTTSPPLLQWFPVVFGGYRPSRAPSIPLVSSSGTRDSNPRHPAWEAGTLPTELVPQTSESFRIPPPRTAARGKPAVKTAATVPACGASVDPPEGPPELPDAIRIGRARSLPIERSSRMHSTAARRVSSDCAV